MKIPPLDTRYLMQSGRPTVIIDGQWGSTGKGKLAGLLCSGEICNPPTVVVCDYMPNAGHTYVDDGGNATVFKQLPVAAMFSTTEVVCLGPHAAIDVDLLLKEIERTPIRRLVIHPYAGIITGDDVAFERGNIRRISATGQGGHAALARKMTRNDDGFENVARDVEALHPYIGNTYQIVQTATEKQERVLIETAQGFDLGLHNGWRWPYVTARDCLVGRALDNAGVPVSLCGPIIASLRTFPIRVGSVGSGTSGPIYPDQVEMQWSDLGVEPEMTTVTKRVRRVFSWSDEQIKRFCRFVRPSHAFLNFVNYWENSDSWEQELTHVDELLNSFGCQLILLGTGARNGEYRRI